MDKSAMLLDFDVEKSIRWLLAHASAPVLYLTRRDLMGESTSSSAMKTLWNEVERLPEVQRIFDAQHADGSWFGSLPWAGKPKYRHRGAESYSPQSPKYVTTAWVLPALGDMGFTVRDVRIRKACEYMLGHRGAEGIAFANEFRPDSRHPYPGAFLYSCCGPAFYLTALAKVGLASDARLSKSWQLVVQLQREDGGWVNQHHKDATHAPYKVWDRSCPYATFRAANALSYGQDQKYEPGLRRALRFLLWHLSTKKPCEICQFYFHGHHILRELQMFARTNEGMDSRPVGAICKWLMTLYHPEDGAFRVAGRPIPSNARCLTGVSSQVLRYNFYHLTEEDWLTLRIVQVAMSPHHLSALQPLRGLPTCAPSAG